MKKSTKEKGVPEMSMEKKEEEKDMQYKPLEPPEIVPNAVPVEFPEINDFLRNMKIKGSLFGFQKEDVYEKMRQLNLLYQNRVQQMRDQNRGQLKQMKKQHQEELEAVYIQEEKKYEEWKANQEQELEQAKARMKEELEAKSREELAQIHKELERLIDRLTQLKTKVNTVAAEKQD